MSVEAIGSALLLLNKHEPVPYHSAHLFPHQIPRRTLVFRYSFLFNCELLSTRHVWICWHYVTGGHWCGFQL